MTMFHAVVWLDHQTAQILQFDAEHVEAQKAKRTAITPLNTGTEHEFFGHVCEALAKIPEVLVVGPKTGLAHFEHYTKKHSPDTATRIVGFEVVDHPTEKQLVASARKHFLKHDRMIGIPTPT